MTDPRGKRLPWIDRLGDPYESLAAAILRCAVKDADWPWLESQIALHYATSLGIDSHVWREAVSLRQTSTTERTLHHKQTQHQ